MPTTLTPYSQQLVPNFEGVGDTMGFGECAWCGGGAGPGGHQPDCKALSRNYPRTSLSVQRDMTKQLRAEMDRQTESAYYSGSARSAFPRATVTVEPPKDERTDLQKRFDAIAEELEENK